MIDFKIEKGGFYRTRDGKKVECVAILEEAHFCCIFVTNNSFITTTIKGSESSIHSSKLDIVGIWEEPKPKRLCYRNKEAGILYMLEESDLIGWPKNSLERFPCVLDES